MTKRLQNKIAESRLALTVMTTYGVLVWLAAGTLTQGWWVQLACFLASCHLMMIMNNTLALIRIYSRMVSCSFIALTCTACFLFPSLVGGFTQLCIIGSLLMLFTTYLDEKAQGRTYYAFALWSLASIAYVQLLWFIPVLWLMMYSNLMALSLRNWEASVLGVLTPYWFWGCWLVFQNDMPILYDHLLGLVPQWSVAVNYYANLSLSELLSLFVTITSMVTGIIHFINKRSGDKIRIRMIFYCFIWLNILAVVLLLLQPQLYDMTFRLMVICTAPLLGHFISLTSTKITNIYFLVLATATLLITLFNIGLWTI